MRSNTIERESLSNATAKNKTSYGSKFLGVASQQKTSPAVSHTSKVQAVPITQAKALSLGGTKTGTVSINQAVKSGAKQFQSNFAPKPSDKPGGFAPSSNLSTFLLSKGSSGSLGTFENEYSYKINLDGMTNAQKQQPVKKTKQAASNAAGGHQIFQEVIVEDEDENFNEQHLALNTSGLGN